MIWNDELGFDFFTSILDPDISSMTATTGFFDAKPQMPGAALTPETDPNNRV